MALAPTVARPSLLLRIPVRQAIGVTDLPVEVRYLRPDPRARLLIVAWDSAEGESGSHAETLSGGSGLVLHRWTITLTPGDYVFSATSVDGLGRVLETFSETVLIHGSH